MISRGESSFFIASRKLGPRFTWQRLSLELADSPTLARLKWNSSTFCWTLSLHSVPAQFRAISFLFLKLRALWSSWFFSLSYVPHPSISKPFWSTFNVHQDPHLLPTSSASTVWGHHMPVDFWKSLLTGLYHALGCLAWQLSQIMTIFKLTTLQGLLFFLQDKVLIIDFAALDNVGPATSPTFFCSSPTPHPRSFIIHAGFLLFFTHPALDHHFSSCLCLDPLSWISVHVTYFLPLSLCSRVTFKL